VCVCQSSENVSDLFGIGGAITDASATVFAKLTKENQQEFLDAYYDEKEWLLHNQNYYS
jgi:glucosylceramidase